MDLLFREPLGFYYQVLFVDYIANIVEFLCCDAFEGCVFVYDTYQLISEAYFLTLEFGQRCDPPDITLEVLSALYFVL